MNTDPKNINPIRASSHPELTSTDTNQKKKFEVLYGYTQGRSARIFIEANTSAEAEEIADHMADEVELQGVEWQFIWGEIEVLEVNETNELGRPFTPTTKPLTK